MKTIQLLLAMTVGLGVMTHGGIARSGEQKAAQMNRSVPVNMRYLLYLPKGYEKQSSWPLLLFLHGAGERGDDLNRVKVHGPPKLIEQGMEFPFIVVSPQCPKDSWWQSVKLVALLDEIAEKYKVDPDRVYVTGLSMGGFGTWRLAALVPQRLAAIVPICGGGEPLLAKHFAHLPVWVFHGAKDSVVPIRRSEEMVEAIKKCGGHPKFTVYPDAGHNSWTKAYDNPQLYQWLLQQHR